MLTARGMQQTMAKLRRFAETLYSRLFVPVGQAQDQRLYQTTTPLHQIPDESLFAPVGDLKRWGGEGMYGWFKAEYTVPEELDGKALYLYPAPKATKAPCG